MKSGDAIDCSTTLTSRYKRAHHSVIQYTTKRHNTTRNKTVLYNSILLYSMVRSSTAGFVLFVGCFTSQQHASVSQGRIFTDNCTRCHTEIEVADPTFYLTQSEYTDTGPTSPSPDPIMPGAWQGSHWSANFLVTGVTRPRKNPSASGVRTRDLPLPRRTP